MTIVVMEVTVWRFFIRSSTARKPAMDVTENNEPVKRVDK